MGVNFSSNSAKCQLTLCQEAPPPFLWVLSTVWNRLGGFTAWLLIKAAYGVEEAWYFTNAMAASSLQNSSSTITPSSNVMWSMLRKRKKKISRESRLKNQPWVLENMQCIYSHGPFWLQAQKAFSDQQKFGSEIWDALDSNHEVPNDLWSIMPSTYKVNTFQVCLVARLTGSLQCPGCRATSASSWAHKTTRRVSTLPQKRVSGCRK